MEQLRQTIGKNIWQFHSDRFKFFNCYTDENSQSGCTIDAPIYLSLSTNDQFITWRVKSIPIGDTMLGYDMYGLDFCLIQNSMKYEKWHIEFGEGNKTDARACFRPIGNIKNIDIFGIKNLIVRDDEEDILPNKPIYHIDANLDLLVTFNTINESKIAVIGHAVNEGVSILVYPKNAIAQYNELLDLKRNQWGEKLFNYKRTIE